MAIINEAYSGFSNSSTVTTTTLYTCPATVSHAVVHVYAQCESVGSSASVSTAQLKIGTTTTRDLMAGGVVVGSTITGDFSGSFYVKSTQTIAIAFSGANLNATLGVYTLVTGYEVP